MPVLRGASAATSGSDHGPPVTGPELLLILAAGLGAGLLTSTVGVASLVSFPVLVALGIPPVVANASNTVGLVPAGLSGSYGYRAELREHPRITWTVMATSGLGATVGVALLLGLPPSVFEAQGCGGCHTLSAAATHGSATNVSQKERTDGPNLDFRRETVQDVLFAIRNGGFSGSIMPANVVVGGDAAKVAVPSLTLSELFCHQVTRATRPVMVPQMNDPSRAQS